MITYDNQYAFTVVVGDPGADNKKIHLFKAPLHCTILAANLVVQDAQGAGSAGAFALLNYGTPGTAEKATGGTIAAALGGTAVASRIAAATPAAYTLSNAELAAGEWVVLDYQETGDFVEANVAITINYVLGDAGTS